MLPSSSTKSLCTSKSSMCLFFFFNDTATTEIYTLSLHDALPIYGARQHHRAGVHAPDRRTGQDGRSEEHTSELQSPCNLVCRLLLEKKKQNALTGATKSGKPHAPQHRR